jgi:molybdenum cofactor cytidylyltransferase
MNTSRPSPTLAVILAAGESRRMGTPKALLKASRTQTFLQQIATRCQEAGLDVIAVTGAHANEIATAHPEIDQVINDDWQQGQLSSIHRGLEAALNRKATRILIHPVDVPDVRSSTFDEMAWAKKPIAVASYKGTTAHPVSLSSGAALALLKLDVTTLEEGMSELGFTRVSLDDPAVLENINSVEDLRSREAPAKPASRSPKKPAKQAAPRAQSPRPRRASGRTRSRSPGRR